MANRLVPKGKRFIKAVSINCKMVCSTRLNYLEVILTQLFSIDKAKRLFIFTLNYKIIPIFQSIMNCTKGNILLSDTEIIINPVNTVGVMGKGLALIFKQKFLKNYKVYKEMCKNKTINIGKLLLEDVSDAEQRKVSINFPTKKHWQNSSKIEYIEKGLYSRCMSFGK